MYSVKYRLLNGVKSWRSRSGMPLDCVNRIRLWPLRRDDHSGVLIGTGGTRRKHENRSIACARRAIDCTRAGTSGS